MISEKQDTVDQTVDCQEKQLNKGKKIQYTHDGAEIEGYGTGGKVVIVNKQPQFMRDVAPYFAPSFVIIFAHLIYLHTGNLIIPFWLMYFACPISNLVTPEDNQNLNQKSERAYHNDKRFWLPLYAFNFLETLTWIWALILMSDKVDIDIYWFKIKPVTNVQYFLFTLHWGYFAGLNAIAGHELLHKKERINKILGTWSYTKFMYSHFIDEHIQGHHKYIATPEDPASARKNESLYAFIPRSVYGSHVKTWEREVARIKKEMGEDVHPVFLIINNKLTMYTVLHLSILGLIYVTLGWQSLKYQFAYTIAGTYFLEMINYIEHYGLLRQKDENGIYESISKMHSWNQLTSPLLFRLQRHSDHHAHSFRPFQILRRFDEAPTLPFEYLQSLVLCMVPPLWFYMLNPRVDALQDLAKGKKGNKTCFDYYSPMTDQDKKIQYVGWTFLALFQLFLTYFAFFTDVCKL